jgi:hypothetical protein
MLTIKHLGTHDLQGIEKFETLEGKLALVDATGNGQWYANRFSTPNTSSTQSAVQVHQYILSLMKWMWKRVCSLMALQVIQLRGCDSIKWQQFNTVYYYLVLIL